jgi:hypothetical protein
VVCKLRQMKSKQHGPDDRGEQAVCGAQRGPSARLGSTRRGFQLLNIHRQSEAPDLWRPALSRTLPFTRQNVPSFHAPILCLGVVCCLNFYRVLAAIWRRGFWAGRYLLFGLKSIPFGALAYLPLSDTTVSLSADVLSKGGTSPWSVHTTRHILLYAGLITYSDAHGPMLFPASHYLSYLHPSLHYHQHLTNLPHKAL